MPHTLRPPEEPKTFAPGDLPTDAPMPMAGALRSKDLLGSRQAVDIEHNGQRYRLQSTKAGKLILTK